MKKEYYLCINEKRNCKMYFKEVEYKKQGTWKYDVLGFIEQEKNYNRSLGNSYGYCSDIKNRQLITLEEAEALLNYSPTFNGKKIYKKKWKLEPLNKLEGWATAISRNNLARPLEVLEAYRSKDEGLKVLDYGCGRGQDADRQGWDKYDPSWFPEKAKGRYDVVLCTYVLNVIKEEKERIYTLGAIKNHLLQNVGAVAYVTVRRDMKHTDCKTQYDISTKFMESFGFASYHREPAFEIYQIIRS